MTQLHVSYPDYVGIPPSPARAQPCNALAHLCTKGRRCHRKGSCSVPLGASPLPNPPRRRCQRTSPKVWCEAPPNNARDQTWPHKFDAFGPSLEIRHGPPGVQGIPLGPYHY